MSNINLQTTDWIPIEKTEHHGDTGVAYWKTKQYDGIRVRIMEYSLNHFI